MGKHTTHLKQKGVRIRFGPKLTVSKRDGSKVQYNLVSVHTHTNKKYFEINRNTAAELKKEKDGAPRLNCATTGFKCISPPFTTQYPRKHQPIH